MKTIIIVPVFNEESVIRSVIAELKNLHYSDIIVVDDGSMDDTFRNVQKEDVVILRHKINRGKGAAIKTGMEAAKQVGADAVVTFDGDGQHDPRDIKHMVQSVERGYDAVLGTRFMVKLDMPFLKRIGNYVSNIITYILYGIRFRDTQCGFRAYSNRALAVIDTTLDRYEFDTEVLRDIKKYHLRYIEVPVHARYTKYSQKKENRQNAWSWLMTMIRIMMRA